METQEIIDRVYDHVEAGEIDKAVIACLRLARKIGDTFNVVMFLRELRPDTHQLKTSFAQEAQHLNEEASKRLWKDTQDHWIEERTLNVSLEPDDEDMKVHVFGVGQLRRQIEQTEKSIEDLRLPEGRANLIQQPLPTEIENSGQRCASIYNPALLFLNESVHDVFIMRAELKVNWKRQIRHRA